jgi:hypothetical protein
MASFGRHGRAIVVICASLCVVSSAVAAGGQTSLMMGMHRAPSNVCPTGALPLGPAAVASAARVVLSHTRISLRPIVDSATLASDDRERGGEVRTLCGIRAQRRTVVVYLRDRALGRDQSLAQSVYFVSRSPAGYRVWDTT